MKDTWLFPPRTDRDERDLRDALRTIHAPDHGEAGQLAHHIELLLEQREAARAVFFETTGRFDLLKQHPSWAALCALLEKAGTP